MGLSANQRLEDFVAVSPFNYEENCLLYFPEDQPKLSMGSEQEVKYLAEQICRLIETTYGHTLVLFTSYSLMSAVYNQVKEQLSFPLMEVWRHAQDVIHQFKQAPNTVLFAAGSCWEGVDFPGDKTSAGIRSGHSHRDRYMRGKHSGLSGSPRRAVSPRCTGRPARPTDHRKNRRRRRIHPSKERPGLFYAVNGG